MRVLYFLIVLLISISSPAQDACFALFTKAAETTAFGQIKPEFLKQHTDKYDVEVRSPFDVKDQCQTSLCHMYAWGGELENRHKIPISMDFLDSVYIFNASVLALKKGDPDLDSFMGSFPIPSRAAIRRAGIVPESAWKGNKEFKTNPNYRRLIQSIDAIVARAVYLRDREIDEAKKEIINQKASEEINSILGDMLGEYPEKFMYEGKEYTPYTFAKEFFPELEAPLVEIRPWDDASTIARGSTNDKGVTRLRTTMDETESIAVALLDKGQTLYLGFQVQRQFIEGEAGIMTVSGFNYPEMAAPLDRIVKTEGKLWQNGHAVLLVGYEKDPLTGKVRKWKLRNSWGSDSGDKGYYHMYADYFRSFVTVISYINTGDVPVPKFEPWPNQQLDFEFELPEKPN